jgi:hypothetical protein
VLQGHVDVFCQAGMLGDNVQQALGYTIRVRVQETHPGQIVNFGETFEQSGKTIAESQILPVACRVLADQCNFAGTGGGEVLSLANDRLEAAASEFSA